jgi:hypothetical protein
LLTKYQAFNKYAREKEVLVPYAPFFLQAYKNLKLEVKGAFTNLFIIFLITLGLLLVTTTSSVNGRNSFIVCIVLALFFIKLEGIVRV